MADLRTIKSPSKAFTTHWRCHPAAEERPPKVARRQKQEHATRALRGEREALLTAVTQSRDRVSASTTSRSPVSSAGANPEHMPSPFDGGQHHALVSLQLG
mmetsp:Transcript_37110/g.86292  ORF Transcript_37110/g.86292 Transcript_37110/m.86292 type:complete len:101 (-) Transcript_37110:1175-1477(-)